jgi:hypothetical protein
LQSVRDLWPVIYSINGGHRVGLADLILLAANATGINAQVTDCFQLAGDVVMVTVRTT